MALIIICGLSFAGKTTLGNAICAEFGYPQVDVDETKAELYGPEVADEDLSQAEWTTIYQETDARIVSHLRAGHSVVDASRNFRREERNAARSLVASVGAETVVVYVDAPESLVRRRWAENKVRPTRRLVSEADFEEIIAVMEPPAANEKPLIFRHGDDIESWLAEHAGLLAPQR